MKSVNWDGMKLKIKRDNYTLMYKSCDPMYVQLEFDNEIGAKLFIPSGCDADDKIDEILSLSEPDVRETEDSVKITFVGKTTIWERVEYYFTCFAEKVTYGYRVQGQGHLEHVRYFEGFDVNDPRLDDAYYPYFCGPGRHMSYHRPVKEFMRSSSPDFDTVYSFGINSSDKREFMYYEDAKIRVNGDRHYLGGDWLATPSPFLFLLGRKENENRVMMGLVVRPETATFNSYEYLGGEGFGLKLTYDGMTEVNGQWQSPEIVFQACGTDVYSALEQYVRHLHSAGAMPENDRSNTPLWWRKPIFGGWGEQVYHSNRWDMYFGGKHDDWEDDDVDALCTQAAYEQMLATLEEKGIDPTILIVDNRWFSLEDHLQVDEKLWPDMKQFIADQHAKNRKVILWVSPWSYCNSAWGKDIPLSEQMKLVEDRAYTQEIDTDVFYPACKREHKKVQHPYVPAKATLAEPIWDFFVDPLNDKYCQRVTDKIQYLLSSDGLNADGFEFDYTHFLPHSRGVESITPRDETAWGVELLHRLISVYYKGAKKAKSDALVISHTFNSYFNDVVDMLRLQDIYTDRRSIVKQMDHRAQVAKATCPDCVIHTDQHPMPSLEAWREYMQYQPKIGNPCLYYVTGIETTKEKLTEEDFAMLRSLWSDYNSHLK